MSSESDHSWRFENSFCMTYLQHLLATCRHESEYCLSWTQLFWMTGTLLLILAHSKAKFRDWEDEFYFPFPTHVFKFSKGQFSNFPAPCHICLSCLSPSSQELWTLQGQGLPSIQSSQWIWKNDSSSQFFLLQILWIPSPWFSFIQNCKLLL